MNIEILDILDLIGVVIELHWFRQLPDGRLTRLSVDA